MASFSMAPEDQNEADGTEVVIGPREQLFHLLAEASEIEHTLMCSYLYAAFSLKSPDTPGFSSAEADALRRWRKSILGVATEEMSHLLMVANLSVAVGGRPHFGRPNFPVAPGYFPSGVVVKLAPFSVDTLQHFIFWSVPWALHTVTPPVSNTSKNISAKKRSTVSCRAFKTTRPSARCTRHLDKI
jgi:hypothetical protein